MSGAAQMLTVRVPLAVRKQRAGRKLMLTPGGMAPRGASAADITLVKALAQALRWRRMFDTGRHLTIDELATAKKINGSYVCRVLRLTLLAPGIVEAILDGLYLALDPGTGPADVVGMLRRNYGISERRACFAMGCHPSSQRYNSRRDPQVEPRMRLRDRAAMRLRYGYQRLPMLLRRGGWPVN